MESNITNVQKRFRVVRLEEGDICSRTDNFNQLKQLILAHEPMYPDIAKWFQNKVCPGVRSAERVAFIGYLDEKPAVSAVVKRGESAKFCHLHIDEGLREAHLGEIFFSLMAHEVRDLAQSVYFTLPESVWDSKNDFFHSFNFSHLNKANVQYRLFDEELECNAPFTEVWSAVAAKLPKICNLYAWNEGSLASDLLMSIHPKHVKQIFSGKKRYELRRKFSTKWLGHRMNIYATEPAMQLVGQATVRRVVRNSPKEIWKKLGSELGCNRMDFDRYTRNAEEIFAIELDEITPFRVPISRKDIAEILKESLTPPQSYCALKPNKPWGQAVSLATLLQGAFKGHILSSLNKIFSPPKSMIGKGSSACDFQLRRMLS
jgi:predicted transcriptional regulator